MVIILLHGKDGNHKGALQPGPIILLRQCRQPPQGSVFENGELADLRNIGGREPIRVLSHSQLRQHPTELLCRAIQLRQSPLDDRSENITGNADGPGSDGDIGLDRVVVERIYHGRPSR